MTTGTVLAYVWISNQIITSVTVTATPIVLSGDFETSQYVGVGKLSSISYTVTSGTPTGYIQIRFSGASIDSVGDVSIGSVSVDSGTFQGGQYVSGYPSYSSGTITILFEKSGGGPFNFGSTSGTIDVFVTYNVAGSINVFIQVTETSS
jgi:hypothetical protein